MNILYLAHEGHGHGLDPGLVALLVACVVLTVLLMATGISQRLHSSRRR